MTFNDDTWKAILTAAQSNPIPVRWNPNTSSFEPFKYTDDQRGNWYQTEANADGA